MRLIPLIAFASILHATTYYVSNTGSDSNNGTSTGTAWQTIAHVNAQTFNPGDSILLQAGGTWREQLTIPSSGSSGNPITFGTYGAGVKPIITGSNQLSGFSQVTNPTGSVTQANLRLSLVNGTAFVDFGNATALSPFLGDLLTVTDSGGHSITGYIKAAGAGETYGSELNLNPSLNTTTNINAFYDSTIASVAGGFIGNALQLTTTGANGNAGQYTSGDGGTAKGMLIRSSAYLKVGTETVGTCLYSDDSSFTPLNYVCGVPSSWTQFVIYDTDDDAAGYMVQSYLGATSGKTSLFNTSSTKQVLTPSITGVTITSTAMGSTFNWASINASFNYNDASGYTYSITGASSVWTKTVSTRPNVLIFNGTPGVQQASLSTVNSAYSWFYSGTTLYVYSPSSDPSTLYSPLEAGQRNYGIFGNTLSYVTINGIQAQYANNSNIALFASSSITVEGSVAIGAYYFGIVGNSSTTGNNNWTVTGNTVSWSGSTGIVGSQVGNNWLIANNTVFNNAWGGAWTVDANFDAGCGIRMFGGTVMSNNLIQYNTSYNNGLGPTGIWNTQGENQTPPDLEDGGGVMFDTMGTGNVMRYNTTFNNEVGGIRIEADTGSLVYGNVSYGNTQTTESSAYDGIGIDIGFGINGTQVYNNTSYGNQIGINAEGNIAASKNVNNALVINNLATGNLAYDLSASVGGNNDGVNGSGNVYTYNGFGAQATSFIQWGTGIYYSTYSAWEAATGNCGTTGCSHSLQSAVSYVNTTSGDLRLPRGAAALTAGSTGGIIGALGAVTPSLMTGVGSATGVGTIQ